MDTKTLSPTEVVNLVDTRSGSPNTISKFWSAVVIANVFLLCTLLLSLMS